MSQAEQVVRDFCDAWARRDVEELVGFFSEDAVYHNMPMEPAVGLDAIRAVLGMFVPSSETISFEVKHIASDGDVVLTERVDRFQMNGRDVAIPVSGTFEIRDGKIAAWRDYFDLQTWINQTTA